MAYLAGRRRSGETYPVRRLQTYDVRDVLFDFGSVDPGTAEFLIPVSGAQVGDGVVVNPGDEIPGEIFLVHYNVQSAGIVHLVLYNITGDPIVLGEVTLTITVLHK